MPLPGLLAGPLCLALLTACAAPMLPTAGEPQLAKAADPAAVIEVPLRIAPLPGGLDQGLLLHSNRPELIETPGLLLSTRAQAADAGEGPDLDRPLNGPFRLFLHHLARTPLLDPRRIWIGLLARARGSQAASLSLRSGNAALTRPDAPFIALPAQSDNAAGRIWAGPGDRVALASLRGESALAPQRWALPPGEDILLFAWPLPTYPFPLIQQANGLSGLLDFEAEGLVDLSLVALSHLGSPRLRDFRRAMDSGPAGPLEPEATPYDPAAPPRSGAFRYGRVAGLAQGIKWQGAIELDLADLAAQGQLAYPVASLLLNRLGTDQVQSAPLLARSPGSALAAHGNYGLHYRLDFRLRNSATRPLKLALALQQPLELRLGSGQALALFNRSPGPSVRFRGSLHHDFGPQAQGWTHLVLHDGEAAPAFARIPVAAGAELRGYLEWIYPADASPPQLLSLKAAS